MGMILFLFAGGVYAYNISIQATVDRNTIFISDHLIYTLTIEGISRGGLTVEPILPDIPGFEVMDNKVRTLHSMVKNQTRISKNIAYTLMPNKVGKFIIPPASWEYGGKIYKTQPIEVTVLDSDAPISTSLRPGPKKPLFIRVKVDKNEAYINEQITLTAMLLYHGCQPANLDYSLPPAPGFTEESLGKLKCYTRVISGVQYKVAEWKKAIFPSRPGELTIGPIKLKGYILDPQPSRKKSKPVHPHDEFFSNSFSSKSLREQYPFIRNSEPIKLSIKPLPKKTRMVNFSNAVGEFELELSANPTTVKINEPITVTITVSGIGNLDEVYLPVIDYGENFSVYDQNIEVSKKEIGDKIGGEKIFKQIIIPRSIDLKEIPAVTISYFDPSTSLYLMLSSEAIPIKVEPLPDDGEQTK
jgi:oxygen tolerance protein BatD